MRISDGVQTCALPIYAPNTFIRDEVRSRYLGRIRELLGHFAGTPEVTLEIGSLPRAVAERTAPALPARTTADAVAFTGNLDSHYTFDNFVEGRSNQLGRAAASHAAQNPGRSEEHTSELQSLMRTSYAVFCLK